MKALSLNLPALKSLERFNKNNHMMMNLKPFEQILGTPHKFFNQSLFSYLERFNKNNHMMMNLKPFEQILGTPHKFFNQSLFSYLERFNKNNHMMMNLKPFEQILGTPHKLFDLSSISSLVKSLMNCYSLGNAVKQTEENLRSIQSTFSSYNYIANFMNQMEGLREPISRFTVPQKTLNPNLLEAYRSMQESILEKNRASSIQRQREKDQEKFNNSIDQRVLYLEKKILYLEKKESYSNQLMLLIPICVREFLSYIKSFLKDINS